MRIMKRASNGATMVVMIAVAVLMGSALFAATEARASSAAPATPDGPVASPAGHETTNQAKVSATVRREVERVAPMVGQDGARRITLEALRELMKKGDVIIVDARDQPSYEFAHAKGAINVPYGEVEKHLGELPHDKWIVTYCT